MFKQLRLLRLIQVTEETAGIKIFKKLVTILNYFNFTTKVLIKNDEKVEQIFNFFKLHCCHFGSLGLTAGTMCKTVSIIILLCYVVHYLEILGKCYVFRTYWILLQQHELFYTTARFPN